jgi:hypothetical protein
VDADGSGNYAAHRDACRSSERVGAILSIAIVQVLVPTVLALVVWQ